MIEYIADVSNFKPFYANYALPLNIAVKDTVEYVVETTSLIPPGYEASDGIRLRVQP